MNINDKPILDNDIETKRTFFSMDNKGVNLLVSSLGLLIYIIVFALLIPFLLIRNDMGYLLTAYFPNLDILATVLGYNGGPPNNTLRDLWLYLYNPSAIKLFGFFSTTLINYLALLGLTFVVAYNTYKYKSISRGWSRAFFMIIITYLIPGHFIVKAQDIFGNAINNTFHHVSLIHYIIVVLFGLLMSACIIVLEDFLIRVLSPNIAQIIKMVGKKLSYEL